MKFYWNLEKVPGPLPVYLIRAARKTILLSNAESYVFTTNRIQLPSSCIGTIQSSSRSNIFKSENIIVPSTPVYDGNQNLILRIQNLGPLDIIIEKSDIIAELVLSGQTEKLNFPFVQRKPDVTDIALFSQICEVVRIKIATRKRQESFILSHEGRPTLDSDSIYREMLEELELDSSPMDQEYETAVQGQTTSTNEAISSVEAQGLHRDGVPAGYTGRASRFEMFNPYYGPELPMNSENLVAVSNVNNLENSDDSSN